MWTCSMCGNQNKDSYRFCLNCGNPRPEQKTAQPESDTENVEHTVERERNKPLIVVLILLLLVLLSAAYFFFLQPVIHDYITRKEMEETIEVLGNEVINTQPSAAITPAPIPVPTSTPAPTAEPEITPEPTPDPADMYLLPDSNSRYLTREDLRDLTQEQCCLARNEIYARHGRQFNTAQIAAYFSTKNWYQGAIPAASFSETVLNEYELANINFIYQYELDRWGGTFY